MDDLWFCPKCNYAVHDVLMQAAKFNYLCPRCGVMKLGDFKEKEDTDGTRKE